PQHRLRPLQRGQGRPHELFAAGEAEPRRRRARARRQVRRPRLGLRPVTARLQRSFPGRVARRVFMLFVASAFIPLGLVAVLSLVQVKDVLLEEAEQRLAARSKAYGYAVLEHLLVASEAASGAVTYQDRRWQAPESLGRYFRSLAMADAGGQVTPLFGDAAAPA